MWGLTALEPRNKSYKVQTVIEFMMSAGCWPKEHRSPDTEAKLPQVTTFTAELGFVPEGRSRQMVTEIELSARTQAVTQEEGKQSRTQGSDLQHPSTPSFLEPRKVRVE